ncbi:AraC family transcriptional regulator [Pelagicoccus mobilis]|uniref:AraC family transcriptional regulator n=1 Tax=Pelagicoccus mobilis TaxID=415221 RepID=A0A934VJ86_9BACT|nr:AraC family transcriptional regulator [Pelagicoccus mobilis]MBK1875346.1 AraC family transcriptional regulator [Pelagicoccus mobilis]
MKIAPESFTRYLPVSSQSIRWGWHLIDAGRQHVPPGSSYPSDGHPLNYRFDSDGGRVLDEFQVVYIASGKGRFSSRSAKEKEIKTGDALLLFPGESHRYRPDPATGWNEYWLGFSGTDATRVMEAFFSPRDPVLRCQHTGELTRLFDQLLHWVSSPTASSPQLLASHIPMILAFLKTGSNERSDEAALVQQAKMQMLSDLSKRTDLQAIARELGTSYTHLRSTFKKHTGYAPREFENMIKLKRAHDLLLSGKYNVSDTAEALGFNSLHYFSRAFRKAYGQSPKSWLKQNEASAKQRFPSPSTRETSP